MVLLTREPHDRSRFGMTRYAWVWLLVWTLVGGCHSDGMIASPLAQVLGMNITEQTPEGTRLEVVVMIQNPSFVPLPLLQAWYDVTVEGVGRFQLTDRLHRTVPAGVQERGSSVGRQAVHLPVSLVRQATPLNGRNYQVHGCVVYEPPGEFRKLLAYSRIQRPTIAFDGSGQIRAPEAPTSAD